MTMLERVKVALTKAFEKEGRVFDNGQADMLACIAIETLMEPDDELLKKLRLTPEYKETYVEYKFYRSMLKAVLEEK